MTIEFTGERVIPGQVDADLWNEHLARYAFVRQFCRDQRVLDIGCGTGYGTDVLRQTAASVIGLDYASGALDYARINYPTSKWIRGSADALPFANNSFDLAVSFEVIEHLLDHQALLREAARVVNPNGVFIVSTPNTVFYAEARQTSGPNPFHQHEFTLDEFRHALAAHFSNVAVLAENHTAGILIESPDGSPEGACHLEGLSNPEEANYFIAVCSNGSLPPLSSYVHIPRAANVLKERADHIHALEAEIKTKNEWLATGQREHQHLLETHTGVLEELKRSNAWAQQLDSKLKSAQERIVALQGELADEQRAGLQMSADYQERIKELHEELERRTKWAQDTEERLTHDLQTQIGELAKCVDLLNAAESTVVERTNWALDLQKHLDLSQNKLAMARASRWVRLGRLMNIGPELDR